MRTIKTIIIILCVLAIGFRLCCGVFVIQPIGAIPEGKTIVYWRLGMDIPFVSSVDGLLEEKGLGVSLLGRAIGLGTLAEPIMEKEILSFGYSESLYLWSTGGKTYEK
tara:strand:+ start:128 stop:451 length:324 start_codon:yes stop_codon:yes gene_type:complete